MKPRIWSFRYLGAIVWRCGTLRPSWRIEYADWPMDGDTPEAAYLAWKARNSVGAVELPQQ